MSGNITVPGIVTADYTTQSQAFVEQDATSAPFFTSKTHSGSSYVPAVKIRTFGTARTRTSSFGSLHNTDNTVDTMIHAIDSGDGNHYYWYFKNNGNFISPGDVTAFSDIRLKDNILPINNALDKVSQITGITYTLKDSSDKKRHTGVIAQEVEKVLPEAVLYNNDDEKTMSVAYGNMVGLLIEAIKELKQEIVELKKKIQ